MICNHICEDCEFEDCMMNDAEEEELNPIDE